MHIVRLPKYKTDVIIYCLTPVSKPEDQKVFQEAVSTFEIKDYSLFDVGNVE